MVYWFKAKVILTDGTKGIVDQLYEDKGYETGFEVGSKVGIVTDSNTYRVGFVKEILELPKQ